MPAPRTRRAVGLGVSAAVWAAVTLAPADLSREPAPQLDEDVDAVPPDGPLADAFRRIDARLADRVPGLDSGERERLAAVIVHEADRARLDPLLVLAVIEVESRFDAAAFSVAGAMGLMQLREPTLRGEVRRHGIEGNLHDPATNVRAGVRYLRRLMDAFPGEDLALMAYNAGPNRILGYLQEGEIPVRFHAYPRKVRAALRRLQAMAPAPRLAASHDPVPGFALANRFPD